MVTQQFLKETLTYHPDGYFIRTRNGKVVQPKIHSAHRYARISVQGKPIALHRVIFLYHHGYLPECIDHIDGDRTNNRISNLREVTHSQNSLNQKHHKDSSSPYKSVKQATRLAKDGSKKWEVVISINKKRTYLGTFYNIDEAHQFAVQAREKHHGKFARHA